jgi:hypothetical protein
LPLDDMVQQVGRILSLLDGHGLREDAIHFTISPVLASTTARIWENSLMS